MSFILEEIWLEFLSVSSLISWDYKLSKYLVSREDIKKKDSIPSPHEEGCTYSYLLVEV